MQKWKSLEIDEPIDVVIFESLLKILKVLENLINEKKIWSKIT